MPPRNTHVDGEGRGGDGDGVVSGVEGWTQRVASHERDGSGVYVYPFTVGATEVVNTAQERDLASTVGFHCVPFWVPYFSGSYLSICARGRGP